MFQQNLSAPDVGAASAITPGVVDKSGAMRAQAEAQRFKDIQAFGMAAMETGFAIDKHIQTSRLAEKQQTLSESFAAQGLDSLSEGDLEYLGQYQGNLSALQKDQMKPQIYKALLERNYKEAVKSRPWLAEELRRVSGSDAAVELSLRSQAVREGEMVAMQQQREAELKVFSDSLLDDFTKPEVDLFMSQVTPDMSAQDVRNLFYSNPANVARVTMGSERRVLENKAALYTQRANITQAEIDITQANLVTQISQNNLINIQVSGQSAIFSNMENFSSEGQQLLSNAMSSGDSLYMMADGLSKTDQQMAISILQSEYDTMRQQVESAFGGIGAKDIPPVVKSQLQRAESLIETFKGHLSGDSAATRQLQADVRRGDLEMTAEVQSFLKLLKEEDRPAWNLFMANKALDAGGKLDDQRMSLAIRELNQRQLADPDTVPGALAAKSLSSFTDKSLLAISNEAAEALTPEEQRRRSELIAEAAFMPFASLETFQYQDLVESSEALSRLDEGFRNQILAELNPQDRETVGNNMLQSAQSRMRQIAQRVERTSSLSVETGADGRPVIKAERVTFAGMPSSLNMRERNKLTQELNAIYNFMLPAMEMIYPDGLFNDSFENQLNSLILGSQVEGGSQSPFDQAAGVLGQAASSVGNFVMGEAQAMGGETEGGGLPPIIISSRSGAVGRMVGFINELEGTSDHVDHLGIATKAYGVVNDMANNPSATRQNRRVAESLGIDLDTATPEQSKQVAEAVFDSLAQGLERQLPNWSKLSDEGKALILDAKYNTGVTYRNLAKAVEAYESSDTKSRELLARVVRESRRLSEGAPHRGLDNRAARLLTEMRFLNNPMEAKELGLSLTNATR